VELLHRISSHRRRGAVRLCALGDGEVNDE
jgi:hypothetical protein